jgi:hypothetical protein
MYHYIQTNPAPTLYHPTCIVHLSIPHDLSVAFIPILLIPTRTQGGGFYLFIVAAGRGGIKVELSLMQRA